MGQFILGIIAVIIGGIILLNIEYTTFVPHRIDGASEAEHKARELKRQLDAEEKAAALEARLNAERIERENRAREKALELQRSRAEQEAAEEARRKAAAEERRRAEEERQRGLAAKEEARQARAAQEEKGRRAALEERQRLIELVRRDPCQAVSVCPAGEVFSLTDGECVPTYHYGGVIPGSADDQRFDPTTGQWVPNCR
jgi:hypothetical protein